MASLGDFARRIRIRGRQVEEGVNKIVRKVALVCDRELVLETPVDTGRARSNWQVSLGSPNTSEREPYAPGEKLGQSEGQNAAGALAQGQERIGARKSEQDIYIQNNVDYIGRLNDGSSAQAPAGFVQAAIARAVKAARGERVFDGD